MNAKRKGTQREHRTIRLLESAGYECTRSGASLGVFDVIAISRNEVLLVQVKSGRWPSPAERETIEEFPCPPNCRKLIHRWDAYAREPQVMVL